MIAVLGMYPFAHLRDAYDQLWSSIRRSLDDAPDALDRTTDLYESWRRHDLLLGQSCGWPLVTSLPELAVVGAFDATVPFAKDGCYRTVLVASRPQSPAELMSAPGAIAAVNGPDSLSGWISLCAAVGRRPELTLTTGSHAESLRAVAEGRAQLASIDALSFEFLLESNRSVAAAVHIVGHGPVVPSLPLVMSASNAHRRDAMRAAIDAAMHDPALGEVRARLRIRGFVPLDRVDYEPLLALAPPPAD
ncbi:MAG: PhnD/SsuA/transferrin family substrate-binding protein [Actinomycetota bacterium]